MIKKTILVLIALLPLLFQMKSQSNQPFVLKKPLNKSTYNERELKKIKHKELFGIIQASKDEQAIKHYRNYRTLATLGGLFAIGGSVVSFAVTNSELNSSQAHLGGSPSSSQSSDTDMLRGIALGASAAGLVMFIVSRTSLRKSIERYNAAIKLDTGSIRMPSSFGYHSYPSIGIHISY